MRLAVIGIRGYPGVQGGVEIHCENLYPHFENKIQVRVYRRKPYLTQLSHMEDEGVEFIDLPSSRIKGLEAVLHTFLCCLHLIFHRVDVVHVHNIGPGMFIPLLKLAGFRVCMTYHSANYEHKKWGAISKCILRMSEYISLNFADRIIFVNKFQLEKFRKRIQEKSYYLPNGINIKERTESKEFLNKIGAQEGEYLLSVGRLTQEKGFDILIKSIQDLPEVKQVVIAGSCDHGSAYFDKNITPKRTYNFNDLFVQTYDGKMVLSNICQITMFDNINLVIDFANSIYKMRPDMTLKISLSGNSYIDFINGSKKISSITKSGTYRITFDRDNNIYIIPL